MVKVRFKYLHSLPPNASKLISCLLMSFILISNFDVLVIFSIFCFRPFFTYYVSFVQVIVLIVMVSVYSFAPIGTSKKVIQSEV